jgi:hypothetical protein
MGHSTTDEEMISKINLGMVSTEIQSYLQVKQMLTIHPIRSLTELITVLRNLDGQKYSSSSSIPPPSMPTDGHANDVSVTSVMPSVPPIHSVNFSHAGRSSSQRPPHRPTNHYHKQDKRDIKCLRCGGKAHTASQCKKSWDEIQKSTNSSSSHPSSSHRKTFKSNSHNSSKSFNTFKQTSRKREDRGQRFEDFAGLTCEDN